MQWVGKGLMHSLAKSYLQIKIAYPVLEWINRVSISLVPRSHRNREKLAGIYRFIVYQP